MSLQTLQLHFPRAWLNDGAPWRQLGFDGDCSPCCGEGGRRGGGDEEDAGDGGESFLKGGVWRVQENRAEVARTLGRMLQGHHEHSQSTASTQPSRGNANQEFSWPRGRGIRMQDLPRTNDPRTSMNIAQNKSGGKTIVLTEGRKECATSSPARVIPIAEHP